MTKKRLNLYSFLTIGTLLIAPASAQDLLQMVDEVGPKPKEYTSATFKTTRIINLQSIETVGRKSLDFRIMHRFGDMNQGAYAAWGLDGGANIKLSLEYSYDGRLMFGLGRSSVGKMADAFVKYKMLRQTTDGKMPVTVTLFSSGYYTFLKLATDNKYADRINRLSYCHQIIVGRKFSHWFSMQLAPTLIHFNLVDKKTDMNDIFAITGALRVKITARQAITFEYCYRSHQYISNQNEFYDSMGIGWDIETGGHVFQMHFTNSMGINENQFIPYTETSWGKWAVRLGFNISRVFVLSRPEKD